MKAPVSKIRSSLGLSLRKLVLEDIDRERRSKRGYGLEDEGPGVSYGDLPEDVDRLRRAKDGYGDSEFDEGCGELPKMMKKVKKEKAKKPLSHAAPSGAKSRFPGPPVGEQEEEPASSPSPNGGAGKKFYKLPPTSSQKPQQQQPSSNRVSQVLNLLNKVFAENVPKSLQARVAFIMQIINSNLEPEEMRALGRGLQQRLASEAKLDLKGALKQVKEKEGDEEDSLEADEDDDDEAVEEVTPPGKTNSGKSYERVVKALKKKPNVKNPWAAAWSMKNKQKGK